MNMFLQDIRYGIRTLLQKPGFTATAVLTLALGIGANTAIFSIVNSILFKPLPTVRNPDELVVLANRDDHMEFPHGLSYVDFLDYKEQCDELEALAIYTPFPISISGEGRAERTWAICASGDYFSLYGTPAQHGTTFQNDDFAPTGGEALLVMGYDFWQRSYGGDPSIVGKDLEVNGSIYTVAGVMPEGFNGNETIVHIDVYLPLTTMHMLRDDVALIFEDRDSHMFRAVGRVKEGVAIQEARTSLQTIAKRLGEEYPDSNTGIELIVAREKDARPEPSLYGVMKPISIAFMGLVSLVLFIACANVANLLLARGMSRSREFATRAALGASRGRIIRQMLTETLMLALLGGVVGVFIAEVVASALTTMTNNMPGDIPIKTNFHPDARVYGFAFLAASLACVIAGLLPALRSSRVN
ncbi:MAG: ABC transporter permease, partial [Planctomycetota bacterium]|nr:ABC transporter permease [Planctomycetota bacterium]